MAREPNLDTVNRALGETVKKLMAELAEADRENRRLRAELVEARRAADVNLGRTA